MLTLSIETKRTLLAMAAGAVLLALGWALWPKAVGVESVVIEAGPLRVTVEEEGKTRIRDLYTVSAPVTGKVVRMMLETGDAVRKDVNTVAIFEPTAPPFLDARTMRELEAQIAAQKAALALAEAEVRAAVAELQFAESELRRAQTLAGTNTVSERTLERARIDVDTRKAARARAEANVEVRRRELESTQARTTPPDEAVKGEVAPGCCFNVKSPVSGRVLRILQESERVVAAGTPLLEIGDPGNLEIVVDLLSADAVKVREGSAATIEAWGGAPLRAVVTRIEPAGFTKVSALGIEEQRVRTILRLVEPPPEARRLGHEFRVLARIVTYETKDALRLPISALFRNGDGWAAYAMERGRARLTPVEIGQRNAEAAEVKAGMAAGARVILHPSDRVTAGTRVVTGKPIR